MEEISDVKNLLDAYQEVESDEMKEGILSIVRDEIDARIDELDAEKPESMVVGEAKNYLNEQADDEYGAVIETTNYGADLYVSSRGKSQLSDFDLPDGWKYRDVGHGIAFIRES